MNNILLQLVGNVPTYLLVGFLFKYLIDKLPNIINEFYNIKERISILEERTKNI